MMDYFKDRPTLINGAWWGCRGVSRSSADIVLVAPNNDIIELQRSIDVGETKTFKNGPSVRVTKVLLSGQASYADVVVSGTVAPIAPDVAGVPTSPVSGEVCTDAYNTDLVIKIPNKDGGFKSYTYNVLVPQVCTPGMPEPPAVPIPPVIPEPFLPGGKTVKILSTTGYNLPNAYVGKTVEIIAGVLCGTEKSDGEYAILTLDGTPIAEGRTGESSLGAGFVSFKWTVEGESGPRKLCVRVPKSDECPDYSEAVDCKVMMVSSVRPPIEEQLEAERGELRDRLDLIRHEREVAEALQKGDVDLPSYSTLPEITLPEPEPVPEPVIEDVIEEVEEQVEQIGTIKIPSIPIPDKLNLLPTVSIDKVLIGSPPISTDVAAGKRQIKVELKGLTPIYKTVTVEPGQVITITDISFI
jgi:PEGA domain.